MRRNLDQLKSDVGEIAWTVRQHRGQLGYTQAQLAARSWTWPWLTSNDWLSRR